MQPFIAVNVFAFKMDDSSEYISDFRPAFSFNFDSLSQPKSSSTSPLESASRVTLQSKHTRSPSSGSSSSYRSKSVSLAMRALHEHIRELEASQVNLQAKLKAKDDELVKSDAAWTAKLFEVSKQKLDSNRENESELESLRSQIISAKESQAKNEALITELKAHIEAVNAELGEVSEELRLTKVEMHKQVEAANLCKFSYKDECNRLKAAMQQSSMTNKLLQDELHHCESIVVSLKRSLTRKESPTDVPDMPAEAKLSHAMQELVQQQHTQSIALKKLEQDKEHQRKTIERLNTQVNELKLKNSDSEKENPKNT